MGTPVVVELAVRLAAVVGLDVRAVGTKVAPNPDIASSLVNGHRYHLAVIRDEETVLSMCGAARLLPEIHDTAAGSP